MSEKHPHPVNTGLTLSEEVLGGRYQIISLIARGGMAEVYLAKHVQLDRHVALKVLKPPDDADETASFEDRFRLEAQTLAGLDHPNIVTLHDFGELDDGRFFLAMEYVEGPRLTDLVKAGPLQPERAIRLMLQVCSALRYAHKKGVVHRDLKPSNLLLRINEEEGTERVKVVDFGLVKLTEKDQSITRAGLILGSPHCMAPEQVKGVDIDHRADIYAVGVLLFRTITGRYPFHGTNSTATMIAHLNQPVPKMSHVNPSVSFPPGTEAVIRKCLEKSPKARFADMSQLIAALAGLLDLPPDQFASLTISHSSIRREALLAPSATPTKTPRWPILLAVGGLVLTLIGALALAGGVLLATSAGTDTTETLDHSLTAPRTPPPAGSPGSTAPTPQQQTRTQEPGSSAEDSPSNNEPSSAPPATEQEGTASGAPAAAPPRAEPEARPKAPTSRPAPTKPAPTKPAQTKPAPTKPTPPEPATASPATEPSPPAAQAEPAPPSEPASKEEAPSGYMGVPDDLFE